MTLHAIDDVGEALTRVVQGHVASVHQIFTGPVSGDALLILDESGAAILKELLTSEPALPLSIDASAREVHHRGRQHPPERVSGHLRQPAEGAGVVLGSALSIESVSAILESLRVSQQGIRFALVVHAGFRLRDRQVTGYLVIVLSVASLDRLIRAIEDWEHSQHES